MSCKSHQKVIGGGAKNALQNIPKFVYLTFCYFFKIQTKFQGGGSNPVPPGYALGPQLA